MREWTHKARQPRKHKKAWRKFIAAGSKLAALTSAERRRFRQCHFMRGSTPRRVGSHIAMGDTSSINARLRLERYLKQSGGPQEVL